MAWEIGPHETTTFEIIDSQGVTRPVEVCRYDDEQTVAVIAEGDRRFRLGRYPDGKESGPGVGGGVTGQPLEFATENLLAMLRQAVDMHLAKFPL